MTALRVACLSLVLLGACDDLDLDLDLDLTSDGSFHLYDDGTTLVAAACPSGAFLGCIDPYDTQISMTVDGATVKLQPTGALFADLPFEGSAPSPADRTVRLAWTANTDERQGTFALDAALLPDFDFQFFPPVHRTRSGTLAVQRLPEATITVDIVSTCNGVSNEVSYEVDAHEDIPLTGDGPCDHQLTVLQTLTTDNDDLVVQSTRFARTTFSSIP
jgi:hypothetical protein